MRAIISSITKANNINQHIGTVIRVCFDKVYLSYIDKNGQSRIRGFSKDKHKITYLEEKE
jgi:hypothetical protein